MKPYRATYQGKAVIVTHERHVAGGIACDVEMPELATAREWPWTVTRFTVAKTTLEASRSEQERLPRLG